MICQAIRRDDDLILSNFELSMLINLTDSYITLENNYFQLFIYKQFLLSNSIASLYSLTIRASCNVQYIYIYIFTFL